MAPSKQMTNNSNNNNTNNNEIQDIFNSLKEGEALIQYNSHKDIVLVLGNTGAGKSTFTQFIAGNNDHLESLETGEDTGEFIIIDNNQKICNTTITSCTSFPDLVLDVKTNTAFYDCPGFSDTRSAKHEISATYFIKKIIDDASAIKMVFVVNYSSLKQGENRQDFMLLIKHATRMIKSIDKFKHSIALVATKVESSKTDNQVINGIAIFLRQIKDELTKGTNNIYITLDDQPCAVKFIDILLNKDGQRYTRIGLFRRPNEPGILSSITSLQNGKIYLEKIVYENIHFITHEDEDFGYTISADSLNYVHGLVEEINKNIASDITNIGQEISTHYYLQEEQSHEIKVLYNKFKSGYDALLQTKTAINEFVTPKDFIRKIIRNINSLHLNISNKNLLSILNYAQYLTFIKIVSNHSKFNPLEWTHGLIHIIEYLNHSKKWYDFLIKLHTTLSQYEIQQDISKFNVTYLQTQITNNKLDKKITGIHLKQFLEHYTEYDDVKNITINPFKLQALSKILDFTLNDRVHSLCLSNKLVIKGYYVKLSEITKYACPEPIKIINIFALNKVFIDSNLEKTGDEVQLSIIAPTWDVIGSAKIILDGSPGEIHNPAKARTDLRKNGEDGKPGLPGGSAGHFLGIGTIFNNGQYLHVSANGGIGGPGQHGGDGVNGKHGTDPKPKWGKTSSLWNQDGFSSTLLNSGTIGPEWGPTIAGFAVVEVVGAIPMAVLTWTTYEMWLVTGQVGENGTNAGKGGKGGKGGNAGTITIIPEDSKIVISNSQRNNGIEGVGGHVGKGGKNGKCMIEYTIHNTILGYKSSYFWFDTSECPVSCVTDINNCNLQNFNVIPTPRNDSSNMKLLTNFVLHECFCTKPLYGSSGGTPAITNYKDAEIKEPKFVPFLNPSHIINDYKSYIRENLIGNIKESSLREFLDQLENNQSVVDLYDTLGLVNELQALEKQYYKLYKDNELELLPIYKSLLDRINNYAGNRKNYEKNIEYKKALTYLYTATLSKICNINNNLKNNLVVDLNGYLDLVIKNINKLVQSSEIESINEYQKNYEDIINTKTNQAKDFIDTQIIPEINNIFNQIDNQVYLLIDEMTTLQNITREEHRKLIREHQKLENSLILRKTLGIVKIASQFLSFIGPVGIAANTVISGGIMVYESLALDTSSTQGANKIPALPQAVKHSAQKITDQLKRKQQSFKEELHDAEKKLEVFLKEQPSANLKEIKIKISDTQTKLQREIDKGVYSDPASIAVMRNEIKDLLNNQKEVLQKQNPDIDIKIGKQLKIVNHVQNIISIGEISIDYYRKIRNHEAKIDNLGDSIKQVDNKIIQLKQYEENIYKTMIPMCTNIENYLTTMEKQLKDKSHVALDISKWKVQSTIKDIKVQIQKMTKGFAIEEDMTRCIEKLEEGMSIMINVYDRIEDYHDKAELAAYISDISSSKAKQIKVNKELERAINNLDQIIISNLILGQYEIAMNAFKQYIFPFAHYYLADFRIPDALKLDNNTNSLVSHVVENIKKLKTKLSESIVKINKYDKYIHNNIEFNSEKTSPFFVWQHDINKDRISRLLEGQEITIKAEITKSGINKNAIKFRVIGIHFQLTNDKMQNEFDKQLQNFDVIMTHLGNSYYRCNNQFYIITSDIQTISYSLKKNNHGEPLNTNVVYDRIKNNDLILSPYAMWRIKLTNVTGHFGTLAKYKNEIIDLELEGRGEYVDEGIDVCNDHLENYYKVDDTISGNNNIDIYSLENSLAHRMRRDVNEDYDVFSANNSISSSSSSSSASGKLIPIGYNVVNWIRSNIAKLKYLNPVEKFKNWFINDERNSANNLENNFMIIKDGLGSKYFSEDLCHELISDGLKASPISRNYEGNINYALTLADLIVRMNTGVKYENNLMIDKNVEINENIDKEYAHRLMFSAYAPVEATTKNIRLLGQD